MNIDSQQIDPADLAAVVGQASGDAEIALESWEVAPVAYANLSPDSRGLYRVSGSARSQDRVLDWSVVLKVFTAPLESALDDPAQPFYWRREALAYQSGLLDDPAADFVAPRCLGVSERPEQQIWLWLEDVALQAADPWSLERFGVAARQLGRFQGAFLAGRTLPALPWLNRRLIRAWTQDSASQIPRIAQPEVWDLPLLRPFSASVAPAVLQLWAERDRWFDALEQLPRTLCHHDLWRKNLFTRRAADGHEQTIAIDWELVGWGAPGEDLGNLLGVSLLNFDVVASSGPQLAELLLGGYLAGLDDAGWHGDADEIRFAFATAAVLRCIFSTTGWPVSIALNPERFVAETEQRWQHPIEQIVEQWSATTTLLLDLARQARR